MVLQTDAAATVGERTGGTVAVGRGIPSAAAGMMPTAQKDLIVVLIGGEQLLFLMSMSHDDKP